MHDGLLAVQIGCLDPVFHATANLIGHIPAFCQVSVYKWIALQLLPFPQWIAYRFSALFWRHMEGLIPIFSARTLPSHLRCPGDIRSPIGR